MARMGSQMKVIKRVRRTSRQTAEMCGVRSLRLRNAIIVAFCDRDVAST
jgi:hypothetical protein